MSITSRFSEGSDICDYTAERADFVSVIIPTVMTTLNVRRLHGAKNLRRDRHLWQECLR